MERVIIMSNSMKFKYDYKDYDEDISEAIKRVEESFFDYKNNPNIKMKYLNLKDSIYDLHLVLKEKVIEGVISSVKAEDMKNYYWGLLLK